MNSPRSYSTYWTRLLLIAAVACALVGCWEEIHYQPPPGAGIMSRASRDQAEEEAGNFGDDVAASLAGVAEPRQPLVEEVPPLDTLPTDSEPTTLDEPESTVELPIDAFPESRLASWSLGSTLSLAALANDRAASEDRVTGWFAKARQQAEALGTTVDNLPPRPTADQVDLEGRRAMEYLMAQSEMIGPHLASSFGDDHKALFEVAVNSNILLVRYQPDAPVAKLMAAAIGEASERAVLPAELVKPVLTLVEEQAPVKDVRDAVFDMHGNIEQHLSGQSP